MSRTRLALPLAILTLFFASSAAAEKPAPTQRPRRRVEQHDRARSEQEKKTHVHVIDTVTIVGRPQHPMAVFDLNVKSFRFPVGTARYSSRDRRYVPASGKERW